MSAAGEVSSGDSDATAAMGWSSESSEWASQSDESASQGSGDDFNIQSEPTQAVPEEQNEHDESSDDEIARLDFGEDAAVDPPISDTNTAAGLYSTIGTFDTLQAAEVARQNLNAFVYTYDTRYLSAFVSASVYICRSHRNCSHKLKICTRGGGVSNPSRYELLQQGQHQGAYVSREDRGISPILKPEIDDLLGIGTGAGRVRNLLLFKYRNDASMMHLVPGTRQLENRKAYLKALRKKKDGGWEIDNFNVLRNWASRKLCQTRESFLRPDPSDSTAMNDLIVLETFEHTSTDAGTPVPSIGLILTSRALFRCVALAVADQRDSLVMSTDGTYRLQFGGWTLVDCGGVAVRRSSASYVQSFRPWVYMFVPSECAFAYEQMDRALIKYAHSFLDVDVCVASCSIDHSDAIASALVAVWPGIEILTCWEHLLRQAKKPKQLQRLADRAYLEVIISHLRMLHITRSLPQFRSVAKRAVRAWRNAGEDSYEEWFETMYLSSRWERWSVNSSSVPGFLPTQQPIESHHRVIKVIVSDFKKAPTETVLNSVIPRVLLYDADNSTDNSHGHCCEGPLPTDSVVKATAYLIASNNYRTIFDRGDRSIPAKIVFNSTKAMVRPGSLAGSDVTTLRATRFVASLTGRLGPRASINTAEFNFVSLQHVQVNRQVVASLPTFKPLPIWRLEDVLAVRSALCCTCKTYMHSGWACAHVIASLHLLDKLDLAMATQRIPMRGPPGRPRFIGGGMTREDPASSDFFDPNNLLRILTAQPGRVLRWPFVQEFDVDEDSSTIREHRVGQVAGCRMSDTDSVFEWSVSFLHGDHGDTLYYQVEELVTGLILARTMGAA